MYKCDVHFSEVGSESLHCVVFMRLFLCAIIEQELPNIYLFCRLNYPANGVVKVSSV